MKIVKSKLLCITMLSFFVMTPVIANEEPHKPSTKHSIHGRLFHKESMDKKRDLVTHCDKKGDAKSNEKVHGVHGRVTHELHACQDDEDGNSKQETNEQ
ncbi:MAG: hypothetical protein ACE5EH_02035 [Gammaproteobacteria bacterium]